MQFAFCILFLAPAVLSLTQEEKIASVPAYILANIPKDLSLIGTFDEYLYWQDNDMKTQTEARDFCETNGMELAAFPERAHVDFVTSSGALDASWTDWTLEQTNAMYRWGNGGAISSTIEINHYVPIGLRLLTASKNLQAGRADIRHPTICMSHIGPGGRPQDKVHRNSSQAYEAHTSASPKSQGTKAFGMIGPGPFDHHTYYQDDVTRIQSQARVFCDSLQMTLARFPDKSHLDYVSFEGGLDGAWTDGITFYERSMYKTSSGAQLADNIPLVHFANLALTIDITEHKLHADLGNSHAGAAICVLRNA